ncbi:MAG: glycosyltransferase family protein [Myxococcota bacterium]
MSTIYYGVAGEGRGHAARARAITECLRQRHRVVIYANAHSLEMLAPQYKEDEDVEVRALPPLEFQYGADARLDYLKTCVSSLIYLANMPGLIREVMRAAEVDAPDLIITDFEPVLVRVARKMGIPFISLDHQHFLNTTDFSDLPWTLQAYASFMSPFVRALVSGQTHTIVSSFFRPPLKPGLTDVTRIGVMLRDSILEAAPEDRGHVVAYLRRDSSASALPGLARCGRRVRVYGLAERAPIGALSFHPIDPVRFVEDLATSTALVCTAGNQLVGEALYLGKPVLGVPERGNFEQHINAHYLAKSGSGEAVTLESLDAVSIKAFLARREQYRAAIDRRFLDGTPAAVRVIETVLSSCGALSTSLNQKRITSRIQADSAVSASL